MDKDKQQARELRERIDSHADLVRSPDGRSYVIDKDGVKHVDTSSTSTAPYAPSDADRVALAKAQQAERDEIAAIQAEANARSKPAAAPGAAIVDTANTGNGKRR